MRKKRFGYNPVSDILFTCFYLIPFLFMKVSEKLVRLYGFEEWELELWSRFKLVMYIFLTFLVVCEIINCVLKTHYNCLILSETEIVYHSGWLNKKKTTIPLNKIRSCSKSSGPFQRAFGVSNISVTTAGDQITFYSLKGGDEAYEIIIDKINHTS